MLHRIEGQTSSSTSSSSHRQHRPRATTTPTAAANPAALSSPLVVGRLFDHHRADDDTGADDARTTTTRRHDTRPRRPTPHRRDHDHRRQPHDRADRRPTVAPLAAPSCDTTTTTTAVTSRRDAAERPLHPTAVAALRTGGASGTARVGDRRPSTGVDRPDHPDHHIDHRREHRDPSRRRALHGRWRAGRGARRRPARVALVVDVIRRRCRHRPVGSEPCGALGYDPDAEGHRRQSLRLGDSHDGEGVAAGSRASSRRAPSTLGSVVFLPSATTVSAVDQAVGDTVGEGDTVLTLAAANPRGARRRAGWRRIAGRTWAGSPDRRCAGNGLPASIRRPRRHCGRRGSDRPGNTDRQCHQRHCGQGDPHVAERCRRADRPRRSVGVEARRQLRRAGRRRRTGHDSG